MTKSKLNEFIKETRKKLQEKIDDEVLNIATDFIKKHIKALKVLASN